MVDGQLFFGLLSFEKLASELQDLRNNTGSWATAPHTWVIKCYKNIPVGLQYDVVYYNYGCHCNILYAVSKYMRPPNKGFRGGAWCILLAWPFVILKWKLGEWWFSLLKHGPVPYKQDCITLICFLSWLFSTKCSASALFNKLWIICILFSKTDLAISKLITTSTSIIHSPLINLTSPAASNRRR